MSNATKLEVVRFHGDDLLATQREDGQVFVPLKRMCEALGVDVDSQRQKLKTKPWAVTALVTATGADGKSYETLCLSLKSVPMWLATIEPSRVAKEARAKLEVYQLRCAEVLAAHFAPAPANDNAQTFPASAYDLAANLLIRAGVSPGIAAACGLTQLEANTGTNMDAFRKALPSTTEPVATLNATELGKLCGMGAMATNKALASAGLQEKSGKDWALTEAGKEHGAAFPFERNGHTSHQVRWKASAASVIGQVSP